MAQDNKSTQAEIGIPWKSPRLIKLLASLIIFLPVATASRQTPINELNIDLALIAVLLPFFAAGIIPLIYRKLKDKTGYFAAFISATTFLSVLLMGRGSFTYQWVPSLGTEFSLYVDGLSLLIALLASGIGILIFTYSPSYMHGKENQIKYYAVLLAFLGSMMGIALSGDLISLFVFWELTSICSFFLIGFYSKRRDSKAAARKSMIITVGGGLFLLASILMINYATGTVSFVELIQGSPQEQLREAGLFIPVLFSLFVGAAAKSAQVPLHIWLPDAMRAPTPVSAFLHSATMVKAGVFLIGRMRPVLSSPEWNLLLIITGLSTMLIAGILAVSSTDIKELLAYSTASHLGIIVASLGLPNIYGAEAGVLHILNHASFKAPLFLVAGIVAHEAGTRKINKLSGLNKYLPVTSLIAIAASLSMAGIPPFNGFQSKELLFKSAFEFATVSGGLTWVVPAVTVIGGAFSFAYSMKFASLFIGKTPNFDIEKPPLYMILPPAVLLLLITAITAFPQYFIDGLIGSAIHSTALETSNINLSLIPHLSPALVMSFITLLMGLGLFRYYSRLHSAIVEFLENHQRVTANYWYRRSLDYKYNIGVRITDNVFHGSLRGYIIKILTAFSLVALIGFGIGGPVLEFSTSLSLAGIFVIVIAVMAGISTGKSESHVSGVLNLSVLGAMISIFFIVARAPDLALTQLLVETLSLLIFILVLDKLPSYYGEVKDSRKILNGIVAAIVGLTVTLSTVAATSAKPDKISQFFIENAVPEGGGGNIVNVILVDFRGFDTLGEISVIAMSALSILTLLAMRDKSLWFTEVKEE